MKKQTYLKSWVALAALTSVLTTPILAQAESATETSYFTEYDQRASYDESKATKITLSQGSASVTGAGVTVEDKLITITAEGAYIISGESEGVQIKVAATDKAKVQLVLNQVTMTNTDPVIYIEEADKVSITLAPNTQNTLKDAATHTNEKLDAVVYSKKDVTFNGEGQLTIQAQFKNGVESNDDLKIVSGQYKIEAVNHGLNANDALNIGAATVEIKAGKDGIHASNDDDTTQGNVYLNPTKLTLDVTEDGVDASNELVIAGGVVEVLNSEEGLEAKVIRQEDGNVTIKSSDDGVNASSSSSSTESTQAADNTKNTAPATPPQMPSNQSQPPQPPSGEQARPGGPGGGPGNQTGAPGGMDESDPSVQLIINGGTLTVDAEGDGLDSNGTATINGGTVYVNGSVRGGNGALDASGDLTINGGTIVALGTSDMVQAFASTSTQASLTVNMTGNAGDKISVLDQSGKEVLQYTAVKSFQSIVVSDAALEADATYTVKVNTQSNEVKATR